MELHEISRMARDLLREHYLYAWRFQWDGARQRAGSCNYRTRTITLSRHLMPTWSEAAVRETILHEIAHALAGPGTGHGPRWRTKAREVGITPNRCWSPSAESPALPSRWIGTCPNGHTVGVDRRSKGSCAVCSRTFDPALRFMWERNPVAV